MFVVQIFDAPELTISAVTVHKTVCYGGEYNTASTPTTTTCKVPIKMALPAR